MTRAPLLHPPRPSSRTPLLWLRSAPVRGHRVPIPRSPAPAHASVPRHRINTILDSDRILVLDKGKVAEFDTPSALMQKEGSLFASLVQETESTRAAAVE